MSCISYRAPNSIVRERYPTHKFGYEDYRLYVKLSDYFRYLFFKRIEGDPYSELSAEFNPTKGAYNIVCKGYWGLRVVKETYTHIKFGYKEHISGLPAFPLIRIVAKDESFAALDVISLAHVCKEFYESTKALKLSECIILKPHNLRQLKWFISYAFVDDNMLGINALLLNM